ncbi:hypothetical protein [Undibacterium terreum]|uniref:Uncharacterized protein n=1 Tax=Undibacterium terreum TaxID=1224302 RepID=A0A916U9M2_9BURK|nr:hypothetical protein [Undibacterium terreum]GGC63696.1 hypothetical protein GCM10011396_08360 [Undibacterium terreum]
MSTLNISWLKNTLANQGQELSLLAALLKAMKALKDDPATPSQEWFEVLNLLVKALDSGQKPGAAISDGDWAILQAEWASLRAALGDQLPTALRPLTLKLSELAIATIPPSKAVGLLSYPLVSATTANTGAATLAGLGFQTSIAANGQAIASVESDSRAPDWASKIGYVNPDAECFFRIGLQGGLGASAGVTASPAWGSIGISASAQGAAFLDHCFNYPSSRYVAQALLNSLEILPAPGKLSSMLETCQGDDFAIASLDVSGTLSLKGNISAGKVLATSFASPTSAAGSITASVGLSASLAVSWALNGDYHLTVRKTGKFATARLERKISKTSGTTIDLSAQLSITGLQAALDPVLAQVFPSAQPLIARLGKLSDLHGLARDTLVQQLGLAGNSEWDQIAQALVDIGTGGGKTAIASLATAIQAELDGFANRYLDQGSAEIQKTSTALITLITGKLEAADIKNANFSQEILAKLQALSTRVDDAVKELANRIHTADASAATQIAQALNIPATGIANFVTQLQGIITPATSAVGKWLASYEAARTRIAQTVAKIESSKLGLALAYSSEQQNDSAVLLEVAFKQDTPASQALYQAFWLGQLDRYPQLLEACKSNGSAEEIQSIFSQTQQRKISYGFELNFFGLLTAAASTTELDKVSVSSDGQGRILAASDSVSLASAVSLNTASSEASLSLNLEMLAIPDSPPPFNAEFKASGDNISQDNVHQFFRLIEDVGAMTSGIGARVENFLFAGPSGTAARVAQTQIDGTCLLDLGQWNRLLQSSPDAVYQATHQSCMKALTSAVRTGAERGGTDGSPAQWLAEWLTYTGWTEQKFWVQASASPSGKAWSDTVLGSPASDQDPFPISDPLTPRAERASLRRLWEIEKISGGARSAWGAVQAEAAFLAQLPAMIPAAPDSQVTIIRNRLSLLSASIRQGFAVAFRYDIPDLQQPIKVSWRFLGLSLALAQLASPDEPLKFIAKLEADEQGQKIGKLFV